APSSSYPDPLHDALPISGGSPRSRQLPVGADRLLVQARPASDCYPACKDGDHGTGHQGVQGHQRVERRCDTCGADSPAISRPRLKHPAGWPHPDLVWPDLEPGTVSADECKTLAAGTERDRNDPPYHLQGYGG